MRPRARCGPQGYWASFLVMEAEETVTSRMEGLSGFSLHSDCVQGSASLAQGFVPVVWPGDL